VRELHLTNLKKVEAMLRAIQKDHPSFALSFDTKGNFKPRGVRHSWGQEGTAIREQIENMPVGEVLEFKPPRGRTLDQLQSYISSVGCSKFGADSVTTERNSKRNIVAIMRSK
jgi:hypothetical protein